MKPAKNILNMNPKPEHGKATQTSMSTAQRTEATNMSAVQSLYADGYCKLFCIECQETTLHRPLIISHASKETGLTYKKELHYQCVQCNRNHAIKTSLTGQGRRTDLLPYEHRENLKCPLPTNTTTAKKVKDMEEGDEPEALDEEDFDEDDEEEF
jgi:hypothetical protein